MLCERGDYNVVRADTTTGFGGVCAFVHASLKFVPVDVPHVFSHVQLLCFDILTTSDRARFVCAYRPPYYTAVDCDYAAALSGCLEFFADVTYPLFVVGDFNLPDVDWRSLIVRRDIANVQSTVLRCFHELGLSQLVLSPTRRNNILDLVLTDSPDLVSQLSVLDGFSTSDHDTVVFDVDLDIARSIATCPRRNFRAADYESLELALSTVDWSAAFTLCGPVNDHWLCLRAVLNPLIEQFVPLSRPRTRCKRYPVAIARLAAKKRQLWRRHRSSPAAKLAYAEVARRFQRACKSRQRDLEEAIVNSRDLKCFYGYVKRQRGAGRSIAPLSRADGSLAVSDAEKAEVLNATYCSAFLRDDGRLPAFERRVPADVFIDSVSFDEATVFAALRRLPASGAAGPDGLPSLFLRRLAGVLATPLAIIFSASFQLGSVPDEWRLANVCPIFKKGATSQPSNYRPVSLTCVCCKVMESIVSASIMDYLLSNSLLTSSQHGFLRRRSTCTNLLQCFNDWSKAAAGKKPTDIVFFDFRRAFDSVSHEKLLHKLAAYGIAGGLLDWIRDYLHNRLQRVVVAGQASKCSAVPSGVPQGSVLGPLLFVLFINDIVDDIAASKCQLFADDVKLHHRVSTAADSDVLAADVGRVVYWSEKWQLPLAGQKCSTMHLGGRYGHSSRVYSVLGQHLESCTSTRDLGVIISTDLSFVEQIAAVCKKAYQRIALFFRFFATRRRDILVRAYKVFIRPLLEYCTQVWSPCSRKDIARLERVQRYFTRRVFGAQQLSYSDRLAVLQLQTLELRRLHNDLMLVYAITHGNTDLNFDDFFTRPRRVLRGHSLKLEHPASHVNVRKHFFARRVVAPWNSLSEDTVSAPSVQAFRARLYRADLSRFILGVR